MVTDSWYALSLGLDGILTTSANCWTIGLKNFSTSIASFSSANSDRDNHDCVDVNWFQTYFSQIQTHECHEFYYLFLFILTINISF